MNFFEFKNIVEDNFKELQINEKEKAKRFLAEFSDIKICHCEHDDKYQEGYNVGYEDGHNDGYDKGQSELDDGF